VETKDMAVKAISREFAKNLKANPDVVYQRITIDELCTWMSTDEGEKFWSLISWIVECEG
jgi:hypothetical protein